MGRLCIVVPTHNEAENIPMLVSEIETSLRTWDFRLVIVDDNSPDKTAHVAERLNGLYRNIIVLRRAGKLGLGSAVLEGLSIAIEMDDVDRIVTLDGDLSHSPSEIPRLLCASEKADLVQGSRYVEGGSITGWSLIRRLTSLVANQICRLFLRTSVRECTGNFRVYSRECAKAVVNYARCKGFEWVVEAMVVARKHGFTVKEVPIAFNDRQNGKTKLRAMDIASWAFFVTKTVFSQFSAFAPSSVRQKAFSLDPHSSLVIHRSSTLTETVAEVPIVSTTMYALSSVSPGLSDHAESTKRVKSSE